MFFKNLKIVEVYVKPEYFNHRLNATIPGAWMGVTADDYEVVLCRDYEADNRVDAIRIFRGADASCQTV
jgi:hypothetical protein